MKNINRFVQIATAATILVGATGTASAGSSSFKKDEVMEEARICAAAVDDRVGTDNISHIRHTVTDFDYAPVGHALRIRSEFQTESGTETYRVYCIANSFGEPVRLRVTQIND